MQNQEGGRGTLNFHNINLCISDSNLPEDISSYIARARHFKGLKDHLTFYETFLELDPIHSNTLIQGRRLTTK